MAVIQRWTWAPLPSVISGKQLLNQCPTVHDCVERPFHVQVVDSTGSARSPSADRHIHERTSVSVYDDFNGKTKHLSQQCSDAVPHVKAFTQHDPQSKSHPLCSFSQWEFAEEQCQVHILADCFSNFGNRWTSGLRKLGNKRKTKFIQSPFLCCGALSCW